MPTLGGEGDRLRHAGVGKLNHDATGLAPDSRGFDERGEIDASRLLAPRAFEFDH
jgi:hypothetical protein